MQLEFYLSAWLWVLIAWTLPSFSSPGQVQYSSSADLVLDSDTDFFKDVLEDYKETPSDIFTKGQIKKYLSSPIAIKMRRDLGLFRDEMIEKYNQERRKLEPDYITLSQEMTKNYVNWIRKYMKTVVPKDISEEDFSIVAFGSMGRQEVAGPYTDLEAAILIKDQSSASIRVARRIAERMSYRFNQTGENPKLPLHIKGFRPDEEANFPFNFAMHAKGLTQGEAYCLAYKSLGPEKPEAKPGETTVSKEILQAWKDEKEEAEKFYPFEGTWAFITSPNRLANYFNAARYEFPYPIKIDDKAKDESWFLFSKQFLTNHMLKPTYIASKLSESSCADDIGSEDKIIKVAEKISDRMSERELAVIGGFDSIGRNTFHLYGNKVLFDRFQAAANKVLDSDNLREKAMIRILHGLILKFRKDINGGQMFLHGKLSDPTDVKRILYRFEEQVWSTIARLYDLPSQNIRDILHDLAQSGFLSEEFAKSRISLLNNAMGIRWKESILAGGQLGPRQNFLSKETFDEAVKTLEQKLDKLKSKSPSTRHSNQIEELRKKLETLRTLDPSAADAAFPEQDIAAWRLQYSKMSQDLYKRVVHFVGGLNNIQNKRYEIANPDAFRDDALIPDVDISRLMKIE